LYSFARPIGCSIHYPFAAGSFLINGLIGVYLAKLSTVSLDCIWPIHLSDALNGRAAGLKVRQSPTHGIVEDGPDGADRL
jgi:hypothetical protein